jgi:hypothetical protein
VRYFKCKKIISVILKMKKFAKTEISKGKELGDGIAAF